MEYYRMVLQCTLVFTVLTHVGLDAHQQVRVFLFAAVLTLAWRPSSTGVQYFPECVMVMSCCLRGFLLPVSCTLVFYLFLMTLFKGQL